MYNSEHNNLTRNVFLRLSVFHQLFSHWSSPVKIIQWQWRCTVCHLTKTFFSTEEQWAESKNKELWGVTSTSKTWSGLCYVFGFGIFSTDKALRPKTCWCPEEAFVSCLRRCVRTHIDRNSACVFLDRKTSGQAVNVLHVCRDIADIFPERRGGTVKILAARIHTHPA